MGSEALRAGLLGFTLFLLPSLSARADDWPQWMGPNRDGVWRETGLLDKFPAGGPKVLWRRPIGGGYAGPAVAEGRVYVTDRVLKTGAANPQNPFDRSRIAGTERLICLKESDGTPLWTDEWPAAYTVSYAAGPRATPVVKDGKVYVVGAEGDVRCDDAKTGRNLWSAKLGAADGSTTPMWGFSASPLLDGDHLICVGDGRDAVVVALNKDTGKPDWKALKAKEGGYCPPVIYEAGGKRQLIIWEPEALSSLDPQTGQTYWTEPHGVQMGLTIAMPRKMGDLLLVSSAYEGSLLMRFDPDKPAARKVWEHKGKSDRNNETLHCLISTPFLRDGYTYGIGSWGPLRCLKTETDEKMWETYAATSGGRPEHWSNAFLVPLGDTGTRYLLPNEHGELIIANLSPKGYEELSRAKVIEPTNTDPGRAVVWSYPAFANRCFFLRNDKEIIRVSMAAGESAGR